MNNALILLRPGLDSVVASARAEGREGWASAHLEANTEALTFNPGGTGSHRLRHPPPLPPPDSVSDPGLSPALPPFPASREHGPGADFSPVASPQPSGVGSSAAPCLSLLSVRWGRAVESLLQGESTGAGVWGRAASAQVQPAPSLSPLGCSAAAAEAPGSLPSLVTDPQAEGRTAEVGGRGAWAGVLRASEAGLQCCGDSAGPRSRGDWVQPGGVRGERREEAGMGLGGSGWAGRGEGRRGQGHLQEDAATRGARARDRLRRC